MSISEDDYKKYWPSFELSLSLLAGACEVGKDLYLTGYFSGFGGSFSTVHQSKEEAIEHLKQVKTSTGGQIYKINVENLRIYVDSEGKIHENC